MGLHRGPEHTFIKKNMAIPRQTVPREGPAYTPARSELAYTPSWLAHSVAAHTPAAFVPAQTLATSTAPIRGGEAAHDLDASRSGLKNVLLIMVDDLRPQLGAYNVTACGRPMVTPHIDGLARRALTFRNHYAQWPICAPSRNSYMSGRRPDTARVFNFLDDFRRTVGQAWITMPEYFKTHGHNASGCGKTYHDGLPSNFDQPRSWSEGVAYVGYDQGVGVCTGAQQTADCVVEDDAVKYPLRDDGIAARAI